MVMEGVLRINGQAPVALYLYEVLP